MVNQAVNSFSESQCAGRNYQHEKGEAMQVYTPPLLCENARSVFFRPLNRELKQELWESNMISLTNQNIIKLFSPADQLMTN